jgi:hypothetical protein
MLRHKAFAHKGEVCRDKSELLLPCGDGPESNPHSAGSIKSLSLSSQTSTSRRACRKCASVRPREAILMKQRGHAVEL